MAQNINVFQTEKGPSYAKRKEWRFILTRICEFLRLVDYLIQELLHRVVKTSVKRLHEYVGKATGLSSENRKGFLSETDRFDRKIKFIANFKKCVILVIFFFFKIELMKQKFMTLLVAFQILIRIQMIVFQITKEVPVLKLLKHHAPY